jgi:hypothetical protein
MTDATGIARRLQRDGYAVIPGLLSQSALAAARAELGALLEVAQWGSGFDGTRTKRAWAPLAVTRCLDQAALAPLFLDTAEQAIGPGTQFGITCAIQVHPGQQAQVLHYDQGIYPLPRDRDVMITALWAIDDFTAGNGATRIVRQLPQRLQELLGFNQPIPYLGFVNGGHPRDWLMNDQPGD